MSTPTHEDGGTFEPPVPMDMHAAQDAYFGAISPTGGDTVLMQQGLKSAYTPPEGGPSLSTTAPSFKIDGPGM